MARYKFTHKQIKIKSSYKIVLTENHQVFGYKNRQKYYCSTF